ncbi:hypothetical protein BD779DRAFT_1683327 [Infundibulicybe gibba]|nr:hypothetical protein BD779DRAFT_1683327 [Infundibulicybe gibba]
MTSYSHLDPAPDNTLSSLNDFALSHQEYMPAASSPFDDDRMTMHSNPHNHIFPNTHADTPNAIYPTSNAGQAIPSAHTLPVSTARIPFAVSPLPTDMVTAPRNADANSVTNTPRRMPAHQELATLTGETDQMISSTTPKRPTPLTALERINMLRGAPPTLLQRPPPSTRPQGTPSTTSRRSTLSTALRRPMISATTATSTIPTPIPMTQSQVQIEPMPAPQNHKRKWQSLDNPDSVPEHCSGRMSPAPHRPDETPPRKPISMTTRKPSSKK